MCTRLESGAKGQPPGHAFQKPRCDARATPQDQSVIQNRVTGILAAVLLQLY